MFCAATMPVAAQSDFNNNQDNLFAPVDNNSNRMKADSLGTDKEIPRGMKVWTVDERFGDRQVAEVDTLQHMYMNTTFTEGLRGEYNTLGNLGSPRLNRIFIDRTTTPGQFIFAQPYDFMLTDVANFHFTNTYSPITNVTLNSCGNRTNGEDDFKALFAVNAGKRIGVGFRFDYKYGRGYYDAQSTSHFKYTMWGSYLGERYQAHLLFYTLHQKVTENGGITSDDYIKHPEHFNDSYASNEIPTVLAQNWNRNNSVHVFFNHRYSLGFSHKVPMTEEEIKAKKFAMESKKENDALEAKEKARKKAKAEGTQFDEKAFEAPKYAGRPSDAKIAGREPAADKEQDKEKGRTSVDSKAAADSILAQDRKAAADTAWLKDEYVPVTSFIHTLKFDNYTRSYLAYQTPTSAYYLNQYYTDSKYTGDSICDETKHWELKNTLALATLEGFSKWAKAGIKLFASYDIRHFELPDGQAGINKYNEHCLSVGGQLSKRQGKLLHYNAVAEIGITGEDAGTLAVDGSVDLNIPFLGDTLSILGDAFFHRQTPSFYFRTYHARHFWWEENLDKIIHTRLMGTLKFGKTNTTLRVAVDEIKNHTYFSQSYNIATVNDKITRTDVTVRPMQSGAPVNLLTAQLLQDVRWGILNWENVLTYQHSSDMSVIPVPALNVYSNLYIKFPVVKVLNVELGADVRYFTSYEAPDYSPALASFTVQGNGDNNVKVGNYPFVNVYANVHIKHARFFVMMSHINGGSGDKNYFLTPHYPTNGSVFRFGVSWNFFN